MDEARVWTKRKLDQKRILTIGEAKMNESGKDKKRSNGPRSHILTKDKAQEGQTQGA